MGMTYEQFWEHDCLLVVPYRKAYQQRLEHENYTAWLQGMYIYDAFSSVISQAFSKGGGSRYPDKPYEFNKPKKLTEAEKNEKKMQSGIDFMQRMTARFNESYYKRKIDELTNPPGKE